MTTMGQVGSNMGPLDNRNGVHMDQYRACRGPIWACRANVRTAGVNIGSVGTNVG